MIEFVDPVNKSPLRLDNNSSCFTTSKGRKFPVVNGIPRFIEQDNYALSFGLQWNKNSKTQLDSYNKTSLSETRLEHACGGDLGIFNNKDILEAGCGAGRFTEIMLKHKGHVYAIDLSSSIDVVKSNCKDHEKLTLAQADIYALPFLSDSFDIVVCLGVIQHTPSPELTIMKLTQYLKPGGLLVIDHYDRNYPVNKSRSIIRRFLLNKSPGFRLKFCHLLVFTLWPIHHFAWFLNKKIQKSARGYRVWKWLFKHSPIVDHHEYFPELNNQNLYGWSMLDTHDTLTDNYKHLRNCDEIKALLKLNNLEKVNVYVGGNGVEAQAYKPIYN